MVQVGRDPILAAWRQEANRRRVSEEERNGAEHGGRRGPRRGQPQAVRIDDAWYQRLGRAYSLANFILVGSALQPPPPPPVPRPHLARSRSLFWRRIRGPSLQPDRNKHFRRAPSVSKRVLLSFQALAFQSCFVSSQSYRFELRVYGFQTHPAVDFHRSEFFQLVALDD